MKRTRPPLEHVEFNARETYFLRGKYRVDLLRKPYAMTFEANIKIKLFNDLWEVLFKACSDNDDLRTDFSKKIDLDKVALNVDYLILVKAQTRLVAFASGSFINPKLFYLSTTMVLPHLQTTGIGSLITAFLSYVAVKDNLSRDLEPPFFVCRTSNRKAASSLLRAFKGTKLSTETSNAYELQLFRQTADFLHCNFDEKVGVIKNIYPSGLPKSAEIKDIRITNAFSVLGPNDALFVLGKLNHELVNLLVNKTISKTSEELIPANALN